MRQNRSIPNAVVIPELAYSDVPPAAKWLCEKFGFRERLRIMTERIGPSQSLEPTPAAVMQAAAHPARQPPARLIIYR
jgi:uncharacterized glyoxalase superfamily protein PhnB